MFNLSEQKPVELKEFLADYNQASWIGFVSKGSERVKHGQWTVRRAVERDYSDKEDVYIAYNPLKGYTTRKKANIGRLALLYVDLDLGRGENPFEDDATQEYRQAVIDALERNLFNITVPEPSYICESGRGLYLIYKIYQNEKQTKQEHSNAAERWRRINTYLTSQFDGYNADPSVSTDEARVLRIPGSVNSHSGTQVKFYKYSNQVYTLYNVERDYMNEPTQAQLEKLERVENAIGIKCKARNRISIRRFLERHEAEYRRLYNKKLPSEKQLKYAMDIARILQLACPNFRTAGGVDRYIKRYEKAFKEEKAKRRKHSTFIAREDDRTPRMLERRIKCLEEVLKGAPADSFREVGLFLYRLFALELTNDKTKAAELTKELINNMSNPLPEKVAMRTTKSAEKYWENDNIYRLSDATLAAHFGLSVEEWHRLLPQEAYGEDKELRRARNRRYYENKLKKAGELSKKDRIANRREEFARLVVMGKNKTEIREELQISEGTYYADLEYVKENMPVDAPQNVENENSKNLDGIGNSGAVAPSGHPVDVHRQLTTYGVLQLPFEGETVIWSSQPDSGGWYALKSVNSIDGKDPHRSICIDSLFSVNMGIVGPSQ